MRQETATQIRMLLHEDFDVSLHEAADSARFEDLEMDSLDMTGFTVGLEQIFDITIPKEDIKSLVTINDAVNYVEKKLSGAFG